MRAEGEINCKAEPRKLSLRIGAELRVPAAAGKRKGAAGEPAAPCESTYPKARSELDARRELGRLAVEGPVVGRLSKASVANCGVGDAEEGVVGEVVQFRAEVQFGGLGDVQREAANHGDIGLVVAGAVQAV